jgi:hypothetical protein
MKKLIMLLIKDDFSLTCKWLFTSSFVNPSTCIFSLICLGVAATKKGKPIRLKSYISCVKFENPYNQQINRPIKILSLFLSHYKFDLRNLKSKSSNLNQTVLTTEWQEESLITGNLDSHTSKMDSCSCDISCKM